jgi:hypothetical protein
MKRIGDTRLQALTLLVRDSLYAIDVRAVAEAIVARDAARRLLLSGSGARSRPGAARRSLSGIARRLAGPH